MRLLAVHAHPDDESSKGAATAARYAAEGHQVLVVTCTGGERGDVLNPCYAPVPKSAKALAAIRRAEMAAAAAQLGVEHHWLGFVDSGMDGNAPPPGSFAAESLDVPAGRLVELLRRFRPHVVVTYDENGGYPHPDHLMTHRVTMAALDAAADPAAWPEHGRAWSVAKVYYVHIVTKDRVAAIHEGMLHHGLASPYAEWLASWDDTGNRPVTTRVECAAWFPQARRALAAHATQIDPLSSWFSIPLEIQQRCWPTEDYELAASAVDVTVPEVCLFAGLGSDAEADRRGERLVPTSQPSTVRGRRSPRTLSVPSPAVSPRASLAGRGLHRRDDPCDERQPRRGVPRRPGPSGRRDRGDQHPLAQ